ncbi:MAG TPA: apolipoprotein N-acyltransferase [Ghiorsea sp.]|nr:apolipoprotein N-acyltransferase [Ghiorsea sp.]
MNHKIAVLFALILGSAMPYAFAPFNFWWLAFIAFSGWLYLLIEHPKHPLKLGGAFGFGWFGFGGWWLADTIQTYGHLPYVAGLGVVVTLAFMFTLFILFWAWSFCKLHQSKLDILWLFPALGVLEEWLRSFVFTGLPWTAIANLSISMPASSWLSIVGSYGLTALILFIAAAMVLLFDKATRKPAFISLLLSGIIVGLSPHIEVPESPSHKAALIQPVTLQDQKWDAQYIQDIMFKLVMLSEQASDADVIVLPEAAVPMYLQRNRNWLSWLSDRANQWQGSLLFGSLQIGEGGKPQSGMFLMQKDVANPDQALQFVGKHHLVPFGEYVPAWLPFLGRIVPGLSDYHPATDDGILTMTTPNNRPQKFGSIICYESMFPEEAFHRVRNGANVLVVITNDTWYGTSPAAWQHFQASQVRAIENGRYVLRAANSGVSAIIAPDGSVTATMPWWEEGIVRGEYEPLSHQTLYQKWGNIPILSLAFFIIGVAILAYYRREKFI